ncbi:MAG: amidohydrolase family protein [Terracidiphilus sp.]
MIRLDAHQHFWHYSPIEYEWISDQMDVLQRDFLPRDLQPLLKQNHLDGSIAVQARQHPAETRWLLNLAEQNKFIRGVVGWVDLCAPNLHTELDLLAKRKKLVGVRHVLQDEPDDQFMLRPEFLRGISELAAFGLVYDLLLHPRHLPIAVQLVREFPQQAFVLDHLAKPPIASGQREPWKRDLKELAQFPNVYCKLSGMVTEAKWKQWRPDEFTPYLDAVFEAFGASRLMIGSDWPVCTLSSSYSETIGIVLNYTAQLSADQRDAVLGGNCAKVYDIAFS